MSTFEKWNSDFRAQNLYAFNNNASGLLWLKVRAICRGKQIRQFVEEYHIKLKSKRVSEQNAELFSILESNPEAPNMLDTFLKCMNHEWYNEMGVNTDKLKEDLYKVKYYTWGGDQNNSLDKYLISRYVKGISDFDMLQNHKVDIAGNAWNYVQNSWYNNWTSFLIESLFKQNPKVISAVGEIKSVDFFIDNYPIDLKVTFFPNQYMEQKLRMKLGKSSLSWLKSKCKSLGISTVSTETATQQMYTLSEKLQELNHCDILEELSAVRSAIIQEAKINPIELIKWLYENQGEMRFGAENRLYLILVDSENFDQSWKMKRAFALIEPKVSDYISAFNSETLKRIEFQYKKQTYISLADCLFVLK